MVTSISFAISYGLLHALWRKFTLHIREDMHKSSEVVQVGNPYAICMENFCTLRAGFACNNNIKIKTMVVNNRIGKYAKRSRLIRNTNL